MQNNNVGLEFPSIPYFAADTFFCSWQGRLCANFFYWDGHSVESYPLLACIIFFSSKNFKFQIWILVFECNLRFCSKVLRDSGSRSAFGINKSPHFVFCSCSSSELNQHLQKKKIFLSLCCLRNFMSWPPFPVEKPLLHDQARNRSKVFPCDDSSVLCKDVVDQTLRFM